MKNVSILISLFVFISCNITYAENLREQYPIKKTITQIRDNLVEIENTYVNELEPKDRRNAVRQMNEVFRLLKKLEKYSEVKIAKQMSEENYSELIKKIDAADSREKIILIEDAGANNHLTIEQIYKIADKFKKPENRMLVIEFTYYSSFDKQNRKNLLNLFNKNYQKENLKELFRREDSSN